MVGRRHERLSFDDVEILRLQSAAIAGHTLKVVVVEPGSEPLGEDALRERVQARLASEPRARQRVAFTPLRLGPPAWVDDPGFDLSHHVRLRAGTEGIDEHGLRRVAGGIMSERLDPRRPLWAFDLVGPLDDGRTAIVVRIHHALADGIACMRMLSGLLWDRDCDPAEAPPRWQPAPPPGQLGLAAEALRDRGARIPGGIAEFARAAAKPSAWARAGRSLASLPGAVGRELLPGRREDELDRPVGPGREVAFAEAPLAELKAIGHSRPGHVTVNDVLLAAVAGGLRRWLAHGRGEPALRAQVPVSLHHRDEGPGELGNRDSFLNVSLPVGEPDPLACLELISAATAERKRHHDAEELYEVFHALSRVRPLYRAITRLASGPREFALSISNVPGPREPVRIGGRRVQRLRSVAEPAPHHALRVSAISNAGTVSIGFCADPGALPGIDVLAAAVSDSIGELREATGG